MGFIEDISKYIIKYAPAYDIRVVSPIIAQAVLESASGTSELAKVNNFFGLKYRDNRCPSASGKYIKVGSEQLPNGGYVSSAMEWFKFKSMEDGVKGYFDFINVSNYKSLKGITDPRKYLETIKACGYATSLKYVDNLIAVINKYNLTQYDTETKTEVKNGEVSKMVINVHAGHNPDGKTACGASGIIKESTEARKVKDEVIKLLRSLGHTVYDCTEDNGKSQSDVLQKIVKRCNEHKADLDLSIHFNAGGGKGVETLVYNTNSGAKAYALNIVNTIASLGFANRGVKSRPDLYVLKNTKAPAVLIECCFVDSKDDCSKYNYVSMAGAIVKGITGQSVINKPTENLKPAGGTSSTNTNTSNSDVLYRVQVGAFKNKGNADALLKDLKSKGYEAVIVSG